MGFKNEVASENNIEEIMRLYHSLIGKNGCTWDINYPSIDEIKRDIDNKYLFIVVKNDEIIAVAAAGKDEEFADIECFSKDISMPSFLARIGVKRECQNNGIATYLINYVEDAMRQKGYDGIRFLVSKTNPHAIALYDKTGHKRCGECIRYYIDWYCYEKNLFNVD